MAVGTILINTAAGSEQQVFDALRDVEEIVELDMLIGPYDLEARVVTDDFYSLGEIVVQKIRTVPGVVDTQTLPHITSSNK